MFSMISCIPAPGYEIIDIFAHIYVNVYSINEYAVAPKIARNLYARGKNMIHKTIIE